MNITLKRSTLMLLLAAAALITAFFPAFVWPRIPAYDLAGFEVFALTTIAGFFTFLVACQVVALLFEAFLADALGPFPASTRPSMPEGNVDHSEEKNVL